MKFAVIALISMYMIVQSNGYIIRKKPLIILSSFMEGRRSAYPESSSSYAHYYAKNRNAYNHKISQQRVISPSEGRKMLVPVPVVASYYAGATPYVASAHSSGSAHSSAASSDRNYNYQSYLASRRAQEAEPVETDEETSTPSKCEEPQEPEDNYQEELCILLSQTINDLAKKPSSEKNDLFIKDFILAADNYCDFAALEN